MLIAKCALVLLGIALVQQVHSHCTCGGCGLCGACSGHSWHDHSWHDHGCGLGSGESMCHGHGHGHGGGSGEDGMHCAPLVVRPQPIPKPPVTPPPPPPVPGPCACKKAIVKPAVLPKPVCHNTAHGGCGCSASCTHTCHCNQNINCQSSTILGGDYYNPAEYPPIVLDGHYYNQADYAPADAVSIALAQQKAQEQCALTHSEDKLAFGFRKLPLEIPRVVMHKEVIPEELIYDVNGQIVELKPVKICPEKNLDEEAVEDLMALEADDYTYDDYAHHGFRKISLAELGYGPAKLPSHTFIDVPASAGDAAADAVAGVAESALGSLGGALGSIIGAAGSALGLGGHHGCNSGFVAGNVEFKTVPKPRPICIPPTPDTVDCESEEEEQTLSSELEAELPHIVPGHCCLPCLHNHYTHSHAESSSSTCKKKSKLLIEKCSSF